MSKSAGGIVVFNPDIQRLRSNIKSVLPQVERLYLVDNGSDNLELVRELIKNEPKAVLIENGNNLGVATALNRICSAAYDDGFLWALTLDDDSVCGSAMVAELESHTDIPNAGIIAPAIKDDREPHRMNHDTEKIVEVTRAISSGSLTSLAAWKAVGGFDEAMFIDLVDHDFCANLRVHGYKVLVDSNAVLYHRLGEATEIYFFMKLFRFLHINKFQKEPVYTYNHSPLRTYFYARNTRYFIDKYKGTNAINTAEEKYIYKRWLFLKIFFENQKLAKLRAVIKGRRDAGKMIAKRRAEQCPR